MMWVKRFSLAWLLLVLLGSSAFGEVTEEERLKALGMLDVIESYTKTLLENSKKRETLLNESEKSLNERELYLKMRTSLLTKKENFLLSRESLQNERLRSLSVREASLALISKDIKESKKLFEKQEKLLGLTRLLGGLGIIGAGILGFYIGSL